VAADSGALGGADSNARPTLSAAAAREQRYVRRLILRRAAANLFLTGLIDRNNPARPTPVKTANETHKLTPSAINKKATPQPKKLSEMAVMPIS